MAERKTSRPLQFFRLAAATAASIVSPSNDCVVALRALGDNTRARIVGMLLDAPLDVGEIAKRTGISQYNTSKHLRILRLAGLLELNKQGRRHLYALPDSLRRQAAQSGVLDLGCCSFRFDAAVSKMPRRPRAHRQSSPGRPRRVV